MARYGHSMGTDSAARGTAALTAATLAPYPAAFVLAPVDLAAAFSWVGDNGANGNGDWNTGADWLPAHVPGASASATFATGNAGYTVTGDATIGNITVDGDGVTYDGAITQDASATGAFLTGIDGAFVTLDANAFFDGGAVSFDSGSLLDVQGLLLTTGGTADVVIVEGLSGQAIVGNALTVNQLYVQTGGNFTGDVTLTDGGSVTLDTSSTFGADTITLLGSGSIYEALAPGELTGIAGLTGEIDVSAGGTLTLAADPGVDFSVGGPIAGAGGVLINGGTVEFTGANSYTGPTQVTDATLIADGASALPGGYITLTDAALVTQQPDSAGSVTFGETVFGAGTSDTVTASAGNLLVFAATSANFTFIGGLGADTVVGDTGTLNVTGGATGDLVYGGAGSLTFTGGEGASTIVGGAGVVSATGGAAGDLIYGGTSGADVLHTGGGPSTLVGGAGAQLFATGSANSILVDGGGAALNASASSGNDTLFGGQTGTSDTISGGSGTNIVVLNGGDTELFTGGTTDVFAGSGALTLAYVSGFGGGTTNVSGFDTTKDQISLAGYSAGSAAQILASETIVGGGTILQIPNGGDQVVLFGVTNLTAANFV